MTAIRESREFFLRDKPVNAGSKKDKEVGFPTKNKVKRLTLEQGVLVEKYADVGNRFLEGHIPSAEVWRKFLHSIVFKDEEIPNDDLLEVIERLTNLEQEVEGYDIPSYKTKVDDIETLLGQWTQLLFTGNNSFQNQLAMAQQAISGLGQSILDANTNIFGLQQTQANHTNRLNTIETNLGSRGSLDPAFTEISALKLAINNLTAWFNVTRPSAYDYPGVNVIRLNKHGATYRRITTNQSFDLRDFTEGMTSEVIIDVDHGSSLQVAFTISEPNTWFRHAGAAAGSSLSSGLHRWKFSCFQRSSTAKFIVSEYRQLTS